MEDMFQLLTVLPNWIGAALGVVGAASTVTALTPTPRDDELIGKAYRFLDMLSLNIGHAKDRPPNRSSR